MDGVDAFWFPPPACEGALVIKRPGHAWNFVRYTRGISIFPAGNSEFLKDNIKGHYRPARMCSYRRTRVRVYRKLQIPNFVSEKRNYYVIYSNYEKKNFFAKDFLWMCIKWWCLLKLKILDYLLHRSTLIFLQKRTRSFRVKESVKRRRMHLVIRLLHYWHCYAIVSRAARADRKHLLT